MFHWGGDGAACIEAQGVWGCEGGPAQYRQRYRRGYVLLESWGHAAAPPGWGFRKFWVLVKVRG